MKVFNITDASTTALETRGLANQAIKVGDTVIPKGGSATIRGTARERSELQVFIKVGAIAIDELPPAYAARRGLNLDGTPIPPPKPEPAPPAPDTTPAVVESLRGMDVSEVLEEKEAPKRRR